MKKIFSLPIDLKIFQKPISQLSSALKGATDGLNAGLKKALGTLGDMVNKAKLLSLTLLGAATSAFALANGSIDRRKQSTMWGTDRESVEAVKYADKQTGLQMERAVSNVAGADLVEDWGVITGTTGIKKTENALNDTMEMMRFMMEKFKGLEAGDYRIASLGKEYEKVLELLGLNQEEMRKIANNETMWGEWQKFFSEDYKRNKGKDYESLEKGEQAMQRFVETLKDFAQNTASKFLPALTDGLNSLSKIISNIGDYFINNPEVVEGIKKFSKYLGQLISFLSAKALEGLGIFADVIAMIMGEMSWGDFKEKMAEMGASKAGGEQIDKKYKANQIQNEDKNRERAGGVFLYEVLEKMGFSNTDKGHVYDKSKDSRDNNGVVEVRGKFFLMDDSGIVRAVTGISQVQ